MEIKTSKIRMLLTSLFFSLFVPLVLVAETLSDSVTAAISDANLGAHDIQIKSNGGTITMNGWVASVEDRRRAWEVASSMDGVDRVLNNLSVKPYDFYRTSTLATAVADKVSHDLKNRKFSLHVKETDESLVLFGSAASEQVITDVVQIAEEVAETKAIVNHMRVADSTVSNMELRERVLKAISKNADLSTAGLGLEVNDGVVTLKGSRKSQTDIDYLLTTTLMVEGVKDVISQLTIGGQPYSMNRSGIYTGRKVRVSSVAYQQGVVGRYVTMSY